MDSLRIILIIIGIGLIAGIYFWERTRRDEAEWSAHKSADPVHDPLFHSPEQEAGEASADSAEPTTSSVRNPHVPDDMLILHLLAPGELAFGGDELFEVIESHGFTLNEGGIYQFLDEGELLFSLANMVEPGTFNPRHGDEFETDGLVLYMRLPKNRVIARELFQQFLHVAARLAEQTGGELFDADRRRLSEERIGEIVEHYALVPDADD